MNQTHRIEQAYYKALGIETTYKDNPELEYDALIDASGNEMRSILFSSTAGFAIMQQEEINVEFQHDCIIAWHPEGTTNHGAHYSDEQWKSNLWVLNAAIVMAATDKLNQMKLEAIK